MNGIGIQKIRTAPGWGWFEKYWRSPTPALSRPPDGSTGRPEELRSQSRSTHCAVSTSRRCSPVRSIISPLRPGRTKALIIAQRKLNRRRAGSIRQALQKRAGFLASRPSEFRRGQELFKPPSGHQPDLIPQFQSLPHVVGDEQGGLSQILGQSLKFRADFMQRYGIQGAERLYRTAAPEDPPPARESHSTRCLCPPESSRGYRPEY